jgi:hypothetical protein
MKSAASLLYNERRQRSFVNGRRKIYKVKRASVSQKKVPQLGPTLVNLIDYKEEYERDIRRMKKSNNELEKSCLPETLVKLAKVKKLIAKIMDLDEYSD